MKKYEICHVLFPSGRSGDRNSGGHPRKCASCVYVMRNVVFAGVMTLLPVLVNGGIHMDGFLDTMDALNSYGSREKKLEILKDSRTGAFAVIGFGLYLVASLALWSEAKSEMLPVIGAGYVMSRSLSGLSVMVFPSAKKTDLDEPFRSRHTGNGWQL